VIVQIAATEVTAAATVVVIGANAANAVTLNKS
jgi:hypothetical protein